MTKPTVVIRHRRYHSASHRVRYVTSPKKGRREEVSETNEPRVAAVVPIGFDIPDQDNRDDITTRLMALAETPGRNQLVEFLFCMDPSRTDRDQAQTDVVTLAKDLHKHLGLRRSLLVIHRDRLHVHGHLLAPNDRGDGLALQIDPSLFNTIRNNVDYWSSANVRSAAGIGRELERELLPLTPRELHDKLQSGEVKILRNKVGKIAGFAATKPSARSKKKRRWNARLRIMKRLNPSFVSTLCEAFLLDLPATPKPEQHKAKQANEETLQKTLQELVNNRPYTR